MSYISAQTRDTLTQNTGKAYSYVPVLYVLSGIQDMYSSEQWNLEDSCITANDIP